MLKFRFDRRIICLFLPDSLGETNRKLLNFTEQNKTPSGKCTININSAFARLTKSLFPFFYFYFYCFLQDPHTPPSLPLTIRRYLLTLGAHCFGTMRVIRDFDLGRTEYTGLKQKRTILRCDLKTNISVACTASVFRGVLPVFCCVST